MSPKKRTSPSRPASANATEIFERLSYYAVFASLVRYLIEDLKFPTETATTLGGIFGCAVWVMAIFGGPVADKIGFRRALALAYFILSCAYFLVGSIGAPWLAPLRTAIPVLLVVVILQQLLTEDEQRSVCTYRKSGGRLMELPARNSSNA